MKKPPAKLTNADRKRIYEMRHIEGMAWRPIYDAYPYTPKASLRRIAHRYKNYAAKQQSKKPISSSPPPPILEQPGADRHKVEFTEAPDGTAVVMSESSRIKTLDELLRAAKVDLTKWMVDGWTANAWEQGAKMNGDVVITTLHQVKARLVRNRTEVVGDLIEEMRQELRTVSPVVPLPVVKRPSTGYQLEISAPDLHFGKWAWADETGTPYDMEIAEELFCWAASEIVTQASAIAQPDKIILPLGNDFFNADNRLGTTTSGTPQDNHGLHKQQFRRARLMVRRVVDNLTAVAPVKIIIVPGNHDEETMYYLGEALEDWYYGNELVEVDNAPSPRKYHQHGRCLLGFTHGNKERHDRLPMLMAQEQPHAWANTNGGYREFHIGHYHKKQEMKYLPVNEVDGVRVRIIPSLSATDTWHHGKGFIASVRAAEGFLWHDRFGLKTQFTANAAEAQSLLGLN